MDTDNKNQMSDDELLSQFFSAHMSQPQDNGFSERVMRQLPQRARRMNRIWSGICALLAAALFLLLDGVDQLRVVGSRFVGDAVGYVASFDISALSVVMIVVAFIVLLSVFLSNLLPTR